MEVQRASVTNPADCRRSSVRYGPRGEYLSTPRLIRTKRRSSSDVLSALQEVVLTERVYKMLPEGAGLCHLARGAAWLLRRGYHLEQTYKAFWQGKGPACVLGPSNDIAHLGSPA